MAVFEDLIILNPFSEPDKSGSHQRLMLVEENSQYCELDKTPISATFKLHSVTLHVAYRNVIM